MGMPQGKFRFNWTPESHRIYYGSAVDGRGSVIDEVLVLAMLQPRSYTCEHVLELHTHGGGVSAQRMLRAVIEAGARPARPGEFTMRAFLNGRLDLSQVCGWRGCGRQGCDALRNTVLLLRGLPRC
jgi:tRNA modification GTPase